MNKTLIWVVVVVLIVAAALAYKMGVFSGGESTSRQTEQEMILGETENVELPDLNAEFQAIDQDLNQL